MPETETKSPKTTLMSSGRTKSATKTRVPQRKRVLILDLGDVLFHYSIHSITALPAPTFKSIIRSPAWGALECSLITEDVAVQRISETLSLDIDTIYEALAQCRKLLRVDDDLFSDLIALKQEVNGNLRVYAMTNISKGDFARLKVLAPRWNELFNQDFTSFEVGKIKPDLGYYQLVIESIGLADPNEAVFVDDKKVNVDAARSFGIHGMVFESPETLMRGLRSLFLDPTVPLGSA